MGPKVRRDDGKLRRDIKSVGNFDDFKEKWRRRNKGSAAVGRANQNKVGKLGHLDRERIAR